MKEPRDVSLMRACLRRWPFHRGKGVLMRLFTPLLRDRTFVMEVEPGVVVPAILEDYVIYWGFVHGYQSDTPWELSRRMIRPGDTVFDIGANMGIWAMSAARIAGRGGALHAFEPVPWIYERLTQHLALNSIDWVHCRQSAIAETSGTTTFYASSNGNSGMGGLARREGVDRPFTTQFQSLDEYCRKHAIGRVDFMKVDVEGAEHLVFKGARSVLTASDAPAIMFEVNESAAAAFGVSSATVKQLLHELGYGIYRYDGADIVPVPIGARHAHEDLFALKPHHFELHPYLKARSQDERR